MLGWSLDGAGAPGSEAASGEAGAGSVRSSAKRCGFRWRTGSGNTASLQWFLGAGLFLVAGARGPGTGSETSWSSGRVLGLLKKTFCG